MKPLTFADAYGLGLIAKNSSNSERGKIFELLSPEAKKIAKVIITPQETSSKQAKSVAEKLQKRIRTSSQR